MAKKPKTAELLQEFFCDASFLIAYFAPQDRAHKKALKMGIKMESQSIRLYTIWPVISEASTLLLYHYGYSHAMALLQSLPAYRVLEPSESDYKQATALFGEFNRDQKISFNDVLSYISVRQLKNIPVLTFDRDFSKMGLTVFRP